VSEWRPPTAQTFDRAFESAADSPWLRAVFGADLPPEVEPFSFVTIDALRLFVDELAVGHGHTLVDLGCGRGGPGLWLAKTTGASLVGVDFSTVGVAHAVVRAQQLAPDVDARYVVADATDTGLPDGYADALVCIDAIQLMGNPEAVAAEVQRLLRVGGRAGFTTWEDDVRIGDLSGLLESSQLTVVLRQERDDWLDREIRIFERAQAEAGTTDDPGLANLAEEAERALPMLADCRRVVVIAQRTIR
jgi:ubiquinone/menaquinone biosynthesis C-methylase UbiE